MKKFGFIFSLLMSFLHFETARAEGLPANPWQNKTNLQVSENIGTQDISEQVSDVAVDVWSKVRNTEEFRWWSMAEQSQNNETDKNIDDKQNLLNMLENLNRVGYFLPADYKNVIKKMPTTNKNVTLQKSQSDASYKTYADSYNKLVREWQAKYAKTKNNSLNILENSYRRTLETLKRTTGVDINRAINDSVRAFK